jgi:hypothetical protein
MTNDNTTNPEEDPVAVFLKNGGVIQQIPMGFSNRPEGVSYSAWGSPKKKTTAAIAPADDEDDE